MFVIYTQKNHRTVLFPAKCRSSSIDLLNIPHVAITLNVPATLH